MHSPHPWLIALTLSTLFALPASGQERAESPPVDSPTGKVSGGKMSTHPAWFKESFLDITEDVDEAAASDKHVILFLEMNGCPYCYKMLEENFKDAAYSDFIQEKFDVIALNVYGDREVAFDAETALTEKALAKQLGVSYTPTLIFLNQAKDPVARINGYRNPQDFKAVLDYVAAKAYETQTLAAFLETRKTQPSYSFRDHPQFQDIDDLSSVTDKPLAILFEDAACVACDDLHDGHLGDPSVNAALEKFVVVRLDDQSDKPITAPDGTKTTPKQLAETLGISYEPTLVLYDKGEQILRIESMLYRYHFLGLLEYVGERHYEEYPNDPFDYINAKTAKLTSQGKDVSISDE
ncbi:thioredoxin fold domain-containing protein [Thiorhodococcus mannitoliphagus]|uniref:Thioredoxin fold domain-containing protein n=1 Tax=Thiorhodococcus mannitoliphagus TaxID=329406 RepID=A0A6P1DZD5_9GAMM|nr:thioredoxin fold domain-containing protein [Thiorhodococcus mannitoliphagus]NEX21084.1 thioredoxin fold domain-containing protein [Thiorhodococcus mannitoliphagus]